MDAEIDIVEAIIVCDECGNVVEGPDNAVMGHAYSCPEHPDYLGDCEECGHSMNGLLDADDNHRGDCSEYPGNYTCDDCGNVIVGDDWECHDEGCAEYPDTCEECDNLIFNGDDYYHNQTCSHHHDAWLCTYCDSYIGPAIAPDTHYEVDCTHYDGGDAEDRAQRLPNNKPVPIGEQILNPLYRPMTEENIARLSHPLLLSPAGEPLWCGNVLCPYCYQAIRELQSHLSLTESLTVNKYGDIPLGAPVYSVDDNVYLIYDRSEPRRFTIAEIMENAEEFVNGVGYRLNGDDSRQFYDAMWLMPNETSAYIAIKKKDVDRAAWCEPGVAIDFIKHDASRYASRLAMQYQPYYAGDTAYLTRPSGIIKVMVADVRNGSNYSQFVHSVYDISIPGENKPIAGYWDIAWLMPTQELAQEEFERMMAQPEETRVYEYPFRNWAGTQSELRAKIVVEASKARLQRTVAEIRAHIAKVKDAPAKEVGADKASPFHVQGIDGDDEFLWPLGEGEPEGGALPRGAQANPQGAANPPGAPVVVGQRVIVVGGNYIIGVGNPNPTIVLSVERYPHFVGGWKIGLQGQHGQKINQSIVWMADMNGTPIWEEVRQGVCWTPEQHRYARELAAAQEIPF